MKRSLQGYKQKKKKLLQQLQWLHLETMRQGGGLSIPPRLLVLAVVGEDVALAAAPVVRSMRNERLFQCRHRGISALDSLLQETCIVDLITCVHSQCMCVLTRVRASVQNNTLS